VAPRPPPARPPQPDSACSSGREEQAQNPSEGAVQRVPCRPPPSARSLEKIAPRRGAFRLVKAPGSSLGGVERPLATATYDSVFLKFTPNRPPGYTFAVDYVLQDYVQDYVPRQWINPHSLPPPSATSLEKIVPRRGAFRLVKHSGSSLGAVERPLAMTTYDRGFLKFTPNRPPGYTSSFPSAGEGRDNQIAGRDLLRPAAAYPPTNGNAGGKLPRGKRGLGSPFWSFSAAVR
jgi:hypothetical protein